MTQAERDYYLGDLHEAAENLPEETQAFVDDVVAQMSDRLAGQLRELGIRPQQRPA
jgi:ribosome assembly protein YihI (activator of Der GTPase)